jgi:hypothetical protein
MTGIYEGVDADGRMILSAGYGARMVQLYDDNKWPLEQGSRDWLLGRGRGRAFDSAEMRDELPLSGERNTEALNAAYAACLQNGGNPEYEPLSEDSEARAESTRQFGEEFRQKMVRTPEEDAAEFENFKRSRGWDSSDETLRKCFELERYYSARLHQSQPLAPIKRQQNGGF